MVKDEQVRILMRQIKEGSTFKLSAAKAGMGLSTARRYRKSGQLPSQSAVPHTWRTRGPTRSSKLTGNGHRSNSE